MSQNNKVSTVTTETCDSSNDHVIPSSNREQAENTDIGSEKQDDCTPSSSGLELRGESDVASSEDLAMPLNSPIAASPKHITKEKTVFKTPETKIRPVIYKGSPELDKKTSYPIPSHCVKLSPSPSPVHIMARVASVLTSPIKNSLEMDTVRTGFTTPTKVRKIAPKSPNENDLKPIPSYKIEKSPRRFNLRQRARHIAPKTMINRSLYISPTKKAADSLKARARINQKWKQNLLYNPQMEAETETVISDNEDNGEEINERDDDEDIDDQEHLAQLMAASSTIRFQPKNKSKKKSRREMVEDLLSDDIINSDKQRDERDTAFACKYFKDVKETLKNDMNRYEKFLEIFERFDQEDDCPSKLYKEIKVLIPDHPDLVDDFANFLLPEQAVEAGCFMTHYQINKAREFLRKLEILFGRNSNPFQKIIRIIKSADSNPHMVIELIEPLKSILKQHPHLLEELSLFFNDEKPPLSMAADEDFEEIDLLDSDKEEEMEQDDYENITLPDDTEDYGTKQCTCKCHENTEDPKLQKRKKHCIECGITIINGRMYLLTQGTHLRAADIQYQDKKPKWMMERQRKKDENEEEDEENVDPDKLPKRKKPALQKSNVSKENIIAPSSSNTTEANTRPSETINIPSSSDSESDDVGEDAEDGDSSDEHSDGGANLPDLLEHSSNDGQLASAGDESDSDGNDANTENYNSKPWVQEEDELLLSTFKSTEANERIFHTITEKLEGRTVHEVEQRFYFLISLLKPPDEDESDDDADADAANGDDEENSLSEMEEDADD